MPQFSFETKANKRVKEIIADKSTNKVENIIATPFTIDPEYVDKHITIKFESNIKEKEFISTAKQVKLGNYCICMQSIGDMFPYWQNKSAYASLVGKTIVDYYEEPLAIKTFEGDDIYNAINALLRPALPYPCAGDNLALLAATTKKSIYVVNHNFIFRGNYDEFVTLYELKFPNGCKLDSKGRVIIER